MAKDTPTIQPDSAKRAIKALLPVVSDLTEAAVDVASSADVAARAEELAALCIDAAQVAVTLAMIQRRARA